MTHRRRRKRAAAVGTSDEGRTMSRLTGLVRVERDRSDGAWAAEAKLGRPWPVSALALVIVLAGLATHAQAEAAPSDGIHNIQHVVMIMQENRSFDSYFGTYPGANGIPGGVCVPSLKGDCVRPFHNPNLVNSGGPHGHASAVADINNGAMNGFVRQVEEANVCNTLGPGCAGCIVSKPELCEEVMGYHDARELPNYWKYAEDFVLQDNTFQSISSWSLPEHNFLVSGWSATCPRESLDPLTCVNAIDSPIGPRNWTDITYLLNRAHVSWRYYLLEGSEPDCVLDEEIVCAASKKQTPKTPGIWNPLVSFTDVKEDAQLGNIQSLSNFYSAAHETPECGLPSVSWIDPNQNVSEHPPSSIAAGQAYVTTLINAIMRSPCWNSTTIFLSWDDWGGLYDHVVPPAVDVNGYGLRVPGLVISPYAKAGFIDHQQLSHDAYLKFIEDDFLGEARLDPATDGRPDKRPDVREEAAGLGDLTNDFNFDQPPRPPLLLSAHPAPGPASRPPAESTPSVETGVATAVTASSATFNATVDPNGAPVSDCRFEYGTTEFYGDSVPCSPLPGSGESPVPVQAVGSLMSAHAIYMFRIVATNEYGTSYGSYHTILEAPEFGRCEKIAPVYEGTKAVYHGRFGTSAACTIASSLQTGEYEWYPGALKAGFTTSLSGLAATLETVNRVKVTCNSESGIGAITSAETVGNVVIKFRGCESATKKCTTAGLAEGELETKKLEGVLGIESITIKEGKETRHVGLDLYPVGKTGALIEYTCTGSAPTTLTGSIIGPVPADKMFTTATVKHAATAGKQKPERFEGGEKDVLTNALNEQVGLTDTATQTNEEAFEINAFF